MTDRNCPQRCSRLTGTPVSVLVLLILTMFPAPAGTIPQGLLFHASFDKLTTDAEFAKGDPVCSLDAKLDFRSAEGIIGTGLLQEPGERCSYAVAGNMDTSQGSFSIWIKPLSWDGYSLKFRHFLTVTGIEDYRMLLYLYPIGDEAVLNYIQVNSKKSNEATWRAGAPVDFLKKGEWTHLVSTWDSKQVRLYANGKRVGEGLVAAPLPRETTGTFTVCPIEFWRHAEWSDPDEKTICDEVRIFDHAFSDDEVLELYAAEIPGGLPDLKPSLSLSMGPDFFAKKIYLQAVPAHLDPEWKRFFTDGGTAEITVKGPTGIPLFAQKTPLPCTRDIAVPEWHEGNYVATAQASDGNSKLDGECTITKPPTPWLPRNTDWKADAVLEPWTGLKMTEESTIHFWNGSVTLAGAFPGQILAGQAEILAAPVNIFSQSPAVWTDAATTENTPHRITLSGSGTLGPNALRYTTLMEFDGLIRTDLTLTPPEQGTRIENLTLEIPIMSETASWYRNPTCADWSGGAFDEMRFQPYGWLGSDQSGLSWFMESDANWIVAEGTPCTTLRPENGSVIVRLHLISKPTDLNRPITYTFGFQPTPVRPLDPNRYTIRWAGGPYCKGVNTFVYGWNQQISALNGRLIAHDPPAQRQFVDRWRAKGMETRSYTCAQCTANLSPEYLFFGSEWNQPYGSSFSGYKRVGDDAPYSMVGVCPQSSFADFLVWCVREHLANDWGGGIYTDIDGAKPCDNSLHGCGFTDAFGRSGRTWSLYAHRGLSRRIYAACHATGKQYYSHAHSNWYSVFNAFNDGWAPGEQYSSKVMKDPYFYMRSLPDRVWRSEFCSQPTGVNTFLLPQIGRLGDKSAKEQRGPSESCIAAAMVYGVSLWSSLNRTITEEVWAVQSAFGMEGVDFAPFWKQQDLVSDNSTVRISLWKKPGRWLVVVANFSEEPQRATLSAPSQGTGIVFTPAWLADSAQCVPGKATVTVPALCGALLTATLH